MPSYFYRDLRRFLLVRAMNTPLIRDRKTGRQREGYMFDDWTRLYRIGEHG